MNTYDQLLQESTRVYEEILAVTTSLDENLHNLTPDEIRAATEHLRILQETAKKTDDCIAAQGDTASSCTDLPLYRRRRDIIREILGRNDLLFPRIHGMLAVISSELEQIRSGKTAMHGYRVQTTQEKRGALISRAS